MTDRFWKQFAVVALVAAVLLVSGFLYMKANQPGGWDGCQYVSSPNGLTGVCR